MFGNFLHVPGVKRNLTIVAQALLWMVLLNCYWNTLGIERIPEWMAQERATAPMFLSLALLMAIFYPCFIWIEGIIGAMELALCVSQMFASKGKCFMVLTPYIPIRFGVALAAIPAAGIFYRGGRPLAVYCVVVALIVFIFKLISSQKEILQFPTVVPHEENTERKEVTP